MTPLGRGGTLARGALFVAAALSVLTAAPAAEAQAGPTTRAPRRVRVLLAASDDDARTFEPSVRELLGRLGVEVTVVRADVSADAPPTSATPDVVAVVVVDLRSAGGSSVVTIDGATGKALARRDLAREANAKVALDQLAHVVQATIEEVLEPSPPPPSPPSPPSHSSPSPPEPTPPPEPRSERRSGLALGLDAGGFLEGRSYGKDAVPVMGGGATVGVAFGRGFLRPAVWASGAYHVPFDVQGASVVGVHQRVLGLRLTPTVAPLATEHILVEIGPDLGIDAFFAEPRSSEVPAGRLSGDGTTLAPVVGGVAAAHLAVGRTADLFLAATVDVDLAPPSYQTRIGGRTEEVFGAARVRPALAFGFTFNVLGAAPYEAKAPPPKEGAP